MDKKKYALDTFSEAQLWNFLEKEAIFAHLRGNSTPYPENSFPDIWAIGAKEILDFENKKAFDVLKNIKPQYWFGFLTYDLKNQIEDLSSENAAKIGFPDAFFFSPVHIIEKKEKHWQIQSADCEELIRKILQAEEILLPTFSKINIQPTFSANEYQNKVAKIKHHIEEGDVYEMNFCMEFTAKNAEIDPVSVFLKLMDISPMPFSSFFKRNHQFAFGASPERFLKKDKHTLISQPIKGTAKRGKNAEEDLKMKKYLLENEKERAENMMIVDLVRNDLAKSAKIGTTYVSEMFGIYTFKHLHQMISTVKCQLSEKTHWADALKNAFPMGSMTGAPKIKAMQLIENFEEAKRELFSGAIGYISPDFDFDFNVVIRHLFYDNKNKNLHFWVGSAITHDAEAEQEYAECFLKAKPIFEALDLKTPILQQ